MPQVIAGATYVVMFKAYLASDHVSEATGKTIAITISKNGGAFGNPNAGATNATEVSSGWYKFSLDATDTATVGPVAWRGAVATIDDAGGVVDVIAQYATPTNITAGTVATVSGNVNGNVGGNVTGSVGSVVGAVGSVTGAVGSVTGAVGSVTGNVGGNVVGTVASVVGAVGSVTGNVSGNVIGTVASVVGNVGGNVTGTVGGLPSTYDFAKGTVAMTESYSADGAAPTPAQALFQLTQYNQDRAIAGTSMTVNKLDGTTPAMVIDLDDATTPTAVSRSA